VSKNGVALTADQLSDGERSLLVIAATIARRLSLLDVSETKARRREAIVLIDELELHLLAFESNGSCCKPLLRPVFTLRFANMKIAWRAKTGRK